MPINDNQASTHDPFVLRKAIALLGVVAGLAGGFFWNHFWAGASLYFCVVTLLDGVSHYALKLKPSTGVDPRRLLASERVTPEQFDIYFGTRRRIRLVSLGVAFVLGGLSVLFSAVFCLKIFCGTYALSTLLGILWVRFFARSPRPKLLRRDDRYYIPGFYSTAGYTTATQWAASRIGWKISGPFVG